MKKSRSRAIPPVVLECGQDVADALRASIEKSISLLQEDKLTVDYHLEDGKIRSINFRSDAFMSHDISYTKASLMCDDQDFAWTFRSHLPLSQMPDPYSAKDLITVLKMALRVLERAESQDRFRLQKTVENNNQIANLLAYWFGTLADDLTSVRINVASKASSIHIGCNNNITAEHMEMATAWLDKIKPCLFLQQGQNQVILGRGSINLTLPISPIDVMEAIKNLSDRYPDLQLPIRA